MVNINGLEWKIVTEPSDFAWFGSTRNNLLEIHIARVPSVDNIKRTITHEVIHAYLFSYGIIQKKFNEEELCEFVANNVDNILAISQQVFNEIDLEVQ